MCLHRPAPPGSRLPLHSSPYRALPPCTRQHMWSHNPSLQVLSSSPQQRQTSRHVLTPSSWREILTLALILGQSALRTHPCSGEERHGIWQTLSRYLPQSQKDHFKDTRLSSHSQPPSHTRTFHSCLHSFILQSNVL